MSSTDHPPSNADVIERHPSERRRRRKDYVVVYSCCCCCCCCLHTLGGVVGAIYAGDFKAEGKSPSSQTLYWNFVSATLALVAVGMMLYMGLMQGIVVAVGAWLLLGPLWFLVAALFDWLWLRNRADLPARDDYLRRLGRISVSMIMGAVVGTGLMFLIALLLSSRQ